MIQLEKMLISHLRFEEITLIRSSIGAQKDHVLQLLGLTSRKAQPNQLPKWFKAYSVMKTLNILTFNLKIVHINLSVANDLTILKFENCDII